jgi:hypothetical protein
MEMTARRNQRIDRALHGLTRGEQQWEEQQCVQPQMTQMLKFVLRAVGLAYPIS